MVMELGKCYNLFNINHSTVLTFLICIVKIPPGGSANIEDGNLIKVECLEGVELNFLFA